MMGLGLWTSEQIKFDPTTGDLLTKNTWVRFFLNFFTINIKLCMLSLSGSYSVFLTSSYSHSNLTLELALANISITMSYTMYASTCFFSSLSLFVALFSFYKLTPKSFRNTSLPQLRTSPRSSTSPC